MRRFVRRRRGVLAGICLVVIIAIAMAPIASPALSAVLVPLPELFAAVVSAAPPAPADRVVASAPLSAPLPSRAPPPA